MLNKTCLWSLFQSEPSTKPNTKRNEHSQHFKYQTIRANYEFSKFKRNHQLQFLQQKIVKLTSRTIEDQ